MKDNYMENMLKKYDRNPIIPEVTELAKAFPYSYEEVFCCYNSNNKDINKTRKELEKILVLGR